MTYQLTLSALNKREEWEQLACHIKQALRNETLWFISPPLRDIQHSLRLKLVSCLY